jgi:urease accessory protein
MMPAMAPSIRAPAEATPYTSIDADLPRGENPNLLAKQVPLVESSPARATSHQARLAVAWQRTRSVVTHARPAGPLRLLAPAGTGPAAWVYQSSLGGGFVGGDDVALEVEVGARAALFLSSQSSTKIYRHARASFTLDATVGDHASLIAWPDPVVCFAGAAFDQVQRFRLAPTANLIVVDAWTSGRMARGERWALDWLDTRLSIEIAGAPVLDDGVLLSNEHGALAERFAGVDACATVVLAGPVLAEACDQIAAQIAAQPMDRVPASPMAWPLVTASRWPWGLVIRIAAAATEPLAQVTRDLLRDAVNATIAADPWARKW